MSKEPKTPTLDRMREVAKESQAIGQFLDWLREERKISLAEWKNATWTCHTCGEVAREEVRFTGWMTDDSALWRHSPKHCMKVQDIIARDRSIPLDQYEGDIVDYIAEGLYMATNSSPDTLLHAYYEIDPKKVEKERRSLLEFMRKHDAAKSA